LKLLTPHILLVKDEEMICLKAQTEKCQHLFGFLIFYTVADRFFLFFFNVRRTAEIMRDYKVFAYMHALLSQLGSYDSYEHPKL
jgi:hypothetical protein